MAESKDSIAPRTAMTIAGGISDFIVLKDNAGNVASGSLLLMAKWSPIVVIDVIPAYFLNSNADTVIIIIAISDPGIFLLNFGDIAITITLTIPIAAFQGVMVPMF